MNHLNRCFSIALVSGLAAMLIGILAVIPAFAQEPGWRMGNTQGYTETTSYDPAGMMGGPGWMMSNTQGYTGTALYGPGGMMNSWMAGPSFRGGEWMAGMWRNGWEGDGSYGGCWNEGWSHWGMMPGHGYEGNSSAPLTTVPPATTTAVSYNLEVQPIFDSRCVACHGGTAGLFLNNYENVLRGGRHGSVVIPGDPVSSRLIHYVSGGYMPAGGPPLAQAQIQTLVNWVAAGAPNN